MHLMPVAGPILEVVKKPTSQRQARFCKLAGKSAQISTASSILQACNWQDILQNRAGRFGLQFPPCKLGPATSVNYKIGTKIQKLCVFDLLD